MRSICHRGIALLVGNFLRKLHLKTVIVYTSSLETRAFCFFVENT
ncbi:hypothetical protein T01_8984, partial [Trichinella spiralis]